ncbi:TPA: hypothetical protein ACIAHZ_000662, partial [Enterobacter roggenkampii]
MAGLLNQYMVRWNKIAKGLNRVPFYLQSSVVLIIYFRMPLNSMNDSRTPGAILSLISKVLHSILYK